MNIKPWSVGLFLVLGISLFTGILFLIGSRQELFSRHLEVFTEFSNLSGLTAGAKVRVSGFDAGEIEQIQIPTNPSDKFKLKLKIEKKVSGIVREDSVVSIATDGVVGDKFISVRTGSAQSHEARNGVTLPSKEPVDIGALMEKGSLLIDSLQGTVTDVRGKVDLALHTITKTVNNADGLITDARPGVNSIIENGTRVAGGVNTLVAGLNEGKGAAGLLLKDEQTREQLKSTLTNVQDASANLDQASTRVNETMADFQSRHLIENAQVTLNNVQSLSNQLNVAATSALAQDNMGEDGAANIRRTLSNLNRGTTNIAEDAEALKHEFFFRGFFKKRGFYNLDDITPAEYLKACERQKDAGTREWLRASTLFVTDSAGQEQMSPAGRLQIDAKVSPIVESLPSYVVIVEGYSQYGTPDQQFVTSRRRADLVREYLAVHFHLRHSDLGIVPLLSTPPQGSGQERWDGAAIMLLKANAKK
jgi:phospholipid/cholesterol/gamma-HCH transport system substrate-binding protein